MEKLALKAYWKANIKILISLLLVWFLASFGFGILWSDELDQIQIGGFKLGFWFARANQKPSLNPPIWI